MWCVCVCVRVCVCVVGAVRVMYAVGVCVSISMGKGKLTSFTPHVRGNPECNAQEFCHMRLYRMVNILQIHWLT